MSEDYRSPEQKLRDLGIGPVRRRKPRPGRLNGSRNVDAEDGADVIHRRLAAVARHYNVSFAQIVKGGLHIMSLVGRDAVLATVSRNGKVETTTLYQQLTEAAADIKPKSITIASSANVFTGDENNRSQVTQFIGMLTHIAIIANGSV
jgi:RecA-family ATPase